VDEPASETFCNQNDKIIKKSTLVIWGRGGAVVKVLHYKPEGRGFDS
jgi:hypothetical protein